MKHNETDVVKALAQAARSLLSVTPKRDKYQPEWWAQLEIALAAYEAAPEAAKLSPKTSAGDEQYAHTWPHDFQLAQWFHETYERLAPSFGYETRKDSAKPWEDVPEKNKKLMIAVCREILVDLSKSKHASADRAELAALRKENERLKIAVTDTVTLRDFNAAIKRAEKAEQALICFASDHDEQLKQAREGRAVAQELAEKAEQQNKALLAESESWQRTEMVLQKMLETAASSNKALRDALEGAFDALRHQLDADDWTPELNNRGIEALAAITAALNLIALGIAALFVLLCILGFRSCEQPPAPTSIKGKYSRNWIVGDHLCLKLTPASRKTMIESMAKALTYEDLDNDGDGTYEQKAEAALAALEALALEGMAKT